jgi:anti-sigma factor RsiW
MAQDPLDDRFRQAAWRGKLSPSEQERLRTWLAAHPEAQDAWQLEGTLTEALTGLPDYPVPSNFTARVLQAVEMETNRPGSRRRLIWARVWQWIPKTSWAALMLTSALLSYKHFQHAQRLDQMAQSVVVVSELASVPSPRILQDFDAIHAMDRTPADLALLELDLTQ